MLYRLDISSLAAGLPETVSILKGHFRSERGPRALPNPDFRSFGDPKS